MIVGSFFHRLLKSVEDFQSSLFLAFDIQHVSTSVFTMFARCDIM